MFSGTCRLAEMIINILILIIAVWTTNALQGARLRRLKNEGHCAKNVGALSTRISRSGLQLYAATSTEDDASGRKLYELAGRGDTGERIKSILADAKGNKNILNWKAKERYGRTPIVIASYYGKAETVKLLLAAKGLDANMGTDFGTTALHFAAHRGHVEVVDLLLAARVKVNVEATGGKWTGSTALDVCEGMGMQGKAEIIDALKKKGAKPGKGKK